MPRFLRVGARGALPRPYAYRKPGYLPFSQARFGGSYPLGMSKRYISNISNALLANQLLSKSALRETSLPKLSEFEDRRLWHPSPIAPARSFTESYPAMGEFAPMVDPDVWRRIEKHEERVRRGISFRPKVMEQLKLAPWWYGFENASKVVICLKRKARREVMHALGLAGQSGFRKPHFNAYSRVRC